MFLAISKILAKSIPAMDNSVVGAAIDTGGAGAG